MALNAATGSTTVLLVGAVLIRLVLAGDYLRYVRSGMAPLLLLAGAVLVLLGLAGLLGALRRRDPVPGGEGHDHDHDHQHPGGARVGWLLLAPVLALLLVAPPALGSFGVDRTLPAGVVVRPGGAVFAPLPAGRPGPVPLTVLEFDQRAADRSGASMAGATLQLTGFVARPRDGDGVRLARYQIACCAADAVAAVVRLVGLGAEPARDSWLTVTGSYRGVGADGVPELTVSGSQVVPAPTDPYES